MCIRDSPGLYSPTGTMQAGGSSYNWLKGQVAKYETAVAKVQGISPYDLINAEAAKSPVGANGVLFLPYLLGERAPRWNPDATAAWLGLKMENQRCDLFRAVLEGVTLNLNIILESFRKSIPIDELLVVGGGAKGALWCQMMADVYNARIKVPVLLEEATSMGAAVTLIPGRFGELIETVPGGLHHICGEQLIHDSRMGAFHVIADEFQFFICHVRNLTFRVV